LITPFALTRQIASVPFLTIGQFEERTDSGVRVVQCRGQFDQQVFVCVYV
jgi:hypothetical protein